jgi:hypothetical protein
MTQPQPNGDPQVQAEGEGTIVPVGHKVPHGPAPAFDLPLGLWDLHTVESWARAVLQEAMDWVSRPPQRPAGHEPFPVRLPQGNISFDVKFHVMGLDDGSVGAAVTFRREAPGGRWFYSHHLVRLDVRASEPVPFEPPEANRT